MSKEKNKFKCVFIGNSNVGKTSIIKKYTNNMFDHSNGLIGEESLPKTTSTIGSEYSHKSRDTPNGLINLDIWDTAGQERYDAIVPLYYKNADVVVICFDLTNKDSFKRAIYWIDVIKNNGSAKFICLVGNKVDSEKDRVDQLVKEYFERYVDQLGHYNNSKKIKELVEYPCYEYFECSAKTGVGINEIFDRIFDFLQQLILLEKINSKDMMDKQIIPSDKPLVLSGEQIVLSGEQIVLSNNMNTYLIPKNYTSIENKTNIFKKSSCCVIC